MKLKTVEVNGVTYAEVQDGKPVFLDDENKPVAVDVANTRATIARLNGEAKSNREAREAAEARLKAFEGIEDAAAALKALETVKNLDAGQLVTAGKVEEIKAAAKKAAEEQVAAADKASSERIKHLEAENSKLMQNYNSEKLGSAFSGSKFIGEKVAVPSDMLQATFGGQFKVDGRRVVGLESDGQPIYSRARPGEVAEFDEALEILIGRYPYRDHILKGSGNSGGGARPGSGAPGGRKTMARKDFEALGPAERMQTMKDGVAVVD